MSLLFELVFIECLLFAVESIVPDTSLIISLLCGFCIAFEIKFMFLNMAHKILRL